MGISNLLIKSDTKKSALTYSMAACASDVKEPVFPCFVLMAKTDKNASFLHHILSHYKIKQDYFYRIPEKITKKMLSVRF